MMAQFLRISCCGFCFLIFFVVGCSLTLGVKKPEGEKEFFLETTRLEKLAREDPATSIRAKSHLQLAFLYVNSRNPQLNYSRALQEMESYLALSPDKAQEGDFQNWLSVLKELDRVRRVQKGDFQNWLSSLNELERVRKDKKEIEEINHDLQTRIVKFRINLEKVQKANKDLQDRVADLQEVIERLKNLDYQMEEKRELIK